MKHINSLFNFLKAANLTATCCRIYQYLSTWAKGKDYISATTLKQVMLITIFLQWQFYRELQHSQSFCGGFNVVADPCITWPARETLPHPHLPESQLYDV